MKFFRTIFSTKGRINRKQYIMAIAKAVCVLIMTLFVARNFSSASVIFFANIIIFMLPVYIMVNNIRRLHDMNNNGAIALAFFLAVFILRYIVSGNALQYLASAYLFFHFYLAIAKGTKGKNDYDID